MGVEPSSTGTANTTVVFCTPATTDVIIGALGTVGAAAAAETPHTTNAATAAPQHQTCHDLLTATLTPHAFSQYRGQSQVMANATRTYLHAVRYEKSHTRLNMES